jgi:hypothetical protein
VRLFNAHFHVYSSFCSVSSLRDDSDSAAGIKWGTLRDLVIASKDKNSDMILNALSLPLGDVSLTAPPKYRQVFFFCVYVTSPKSLHSIGYWLPVRWHGKTLVGRQDFCP